MVSLLAEAIETAGLFARVATVDPISALLVLVGLGIVGVSVGVLGYLSLGALVALLSPSPR